MSGLLTRARSAPRTLTCGAVAMLIWSSNTWAAPIQYGITFDGAVSGSAGAGSFIWDPSAKDMSSFSWDFGGGKTGVVLESILDITNGNGESVGARIFEYLTGQDVVADVIDDGFYGLTNYSLTGPYPSVGAEFYSALDPSTPAKYRMLDGAQTSQGVYVITEIGPVVPIPGAVWLFGAALGSLGWLKRKAG
ncbi:MAG: hypothetical protein L6Q83_10680 [Gammaproteobacteria bacterium]|nr:hypothetical protein [Gammaproteobacteria bacterium]